MSAVGQFRGSAPVLLVKDVVRAHEYYVEKLGFRSPSMWGDPPVFCIAERDGLAIMLSQVDAGESFRPNGDYDRMDAYFWVNDADALCEEFRSKGADVVCEPEDQPYGMREFPVRDLDGHVLHFGHDTTGAA